MRRFRRLAVVAAVVSVAAIVVPMTFASAAGPADNTVRLSIANGAGSITYQDASGALSTQGVTANNKCAPSFSGPAILSFGAVAPTNGSVGFSTSSLGVKTPGEGSSGKCEQVNVPDQVLKVVAGTALGGKTFDFAELDIEAKFNAAINIRLFNGSTQVDASPDDPSTLDLVISCTSSGSDCGPDSADSDNFRVRVPSGANTLQPFTEMRLWATGTNTSGAVALEGGADGTAALTGGIGAAIGTSDSIFHVTPTTTLSVTKTADASSVSVGDTVGYTIQVTNTSSTNNAYGVSVSDTLPTGAGTSWSIDSQTGSACATSGGTLTCPIGTLAPSASYQVHITSSTSSTGTLSNTASASASNASTASATASISVLAPGVTITKVADDGNDDGNAGSISEDVQAGTTIGFTITVANAAGAGAASNVSISDTLPTDAGTSWSIASQTGTACAIASGELSCAIATLPAGGSYNVHLTSSTTTATTVDSPVENTASVTWTGGSAAATASAEVGVWSGVIACEDDLNTPAVVENQASATDPNLADITVTRHANIDGAPCEPKNYVIRTAEETVPDENGQVNVVTFLEDLDSGQDAHYTMDVEWTYQRRDPVNDPDANPATVGGRTFYIDYDGSGNFVPARLCPVVAYDGEGDPVAAMHPTNPNLPWCITGQTYTIDEDGLVHLTQSWDGLGDPRSY